ncbi:uncharacterized protein METZ01_LOCUS311865 [marine metagenome]|uniref:Uncharacterized protein n=1 Tax=marine metagenome TaxID=408172 RepID=A0A382NHF0_9ZZZZ
MNERRITSVWLELPWLVTEAVSTMIAYKQKNYY